MVGIAQHVASCTTWRMSDSRGPLHGLRVIDLSTVIAGPNCARYLADFGAEVIKVENPNTGDSLRGMGWEDPRDHNGLWWKLVSRNKRTIALNLKNDDDREVFLRLVDDAHVLIENFRPGTLERLGLGPDVLMKRNDTIVITRVTGFGQTGPYASRPGFASIAEAMSGLAAISGMPGGEPMLPAFAMTDEVTGLSAAFATMVALHSGQSQVVDVSLLETVFQILGPLISVWKVRGELQERMGSSLPFTVPRGVFQCSDGEWIAVSASSDSVALRVVALLGFEGDDRFSTFQQRVNNRQVLDDAMAQWCKQRTRDEALQAFEDAEAAAGPVLSMKDIADDPHYVARDAIVELDGTPMQGLIAKLSATPGVLKWSGKSIDADGDDIRQHGWQSRD
jgi:crotonobetainyl-CoA:carnitine CoA-transferase CaiB-like acyl-CoA transferase